MTIALGMADQLAGRRCLVTGGLGFIGSNLAHALNSLGADVCIIDALVPQHGGNWRNLDGLEPPPQTVIGNLWDDEVVVPLLADVEIVFNVAGQVSHLESMARPMRDLELNIRSHLHFLETLRRHRPTARIVYTSTRQIYGRPRYLPVDEEHPTNPVDVNGIDKLACEQLHLLYARAHGMDTVALRLTNVYGPRQDLTKNGLGFLPVFVRSALLGTPISLYGDGSQRRDCLHVDDVVHALLLAAVAGDVTGEALNLGHDEVLSLADIARTIVAACPGSAITMVPFPDELAAIDIGSFHGDYSKAKRMLGWTPQWRFADGIENTLSFYKARPWYLSST